MTLKTRDAIIQWLILEYASNHKFDCYTSLQGKQGFVESEKK